MKIINENAYIPLIGNMIPIGKTEEKFEKPKDKSFYFDNSNLCHYYGQTNIEKCIILLFFLIIYIFTLIYYYSHLMGKLLYCTLITTLICDIISLLIYFYILYKLQSNYIFDEIPDFIIKVNDYLILFNSIGNTLLLVFACIQYISLNILLLFIGKYILEIFFLLNSQKIFMFIPCVQGIQDKTEKCLLYIKYSIFCFEIENENDNEEYTKIEDIESFY
jgi:hypothetical protein